MKEVKIISYIIKNIQAVYYIKGLSYKKSSDILELTASDCLEFYFTWMRNSIKIPSSVIFLCFGLRIFTDLPDRHLP